MGMKNAEWQCADDKILGRVVRKTVNANLARIKN